MSLRGSTKKKNEDDNSSQQVPEKFKNFDTRCKDEIDELKMIFYKFFVPEKDKPIDRAALVPEELETENRYDSVKIKEFKKFDDT